MSLTCLDSKPTYSRSSCLTFPALFRAEQLVEEIEGDALLNSSDVDA